MSGPKTHILKQRPLKQQPFVKVMRLFFRELSDRPLLFNLKPCVDWKGLSFSQVEKQNSLGRVLEGRGGKETEAGNIATSKVNNTAVDSSCVLLEVR